MGGAAGERSERTLTRPSTVRSSDLRRKPRICPSRRDTIPDDTLLQLNGDVCLEHHRRARGAR